MTNCAEFKQTVKLVFVGSPLLDIYTECDAELLLKYGLKPDDCVKATEMHQGLLDSVFKNPDSHLSAGGTALNSARIAKWVLADKGQVSFLGCVGEDDYAQWLHDTLGCEGVNPLHVAIPDKRTGVCACLLNDRHERSMVTLQGASACLRADHLSVSHIRERLHEADCIFFAAYLLGHSPEVVFKLIDVLSEKQMFCMSLAAEYICREYAQDLVKIIPRVDVLIGNEREVRTLGESLEKKPLTVAESLTVIGKLPKYSSSQQRIVIVTRGVEDVIVDDGLDGFEYFEVPPAESVVDTVGCGDAFAGGFIANYVLTRNLNASVNVGIKAAKTIAQTRGCNVEKPFD